MNLQDLMYTNCREIEYEADCYTQKSALYGLDCLMLELDSPTMTGLNCIVAYILPEEDDSKLKEVGWIIYESMKRIDEGYSIRYDDHARELLSEIIDSGRTVIIIEEERAYLMAHSEKGAKRLMGVEEKKLTEAKSNPRETNHYHFNYLPALYESFGRASLNYQSFMSGLKA